MHIEQAADPLLATRRDAVAGVVRGAADHARTRAPATTDNVPPTDAVDLYWLPLGAGAHVVRHAGRAYETLVAAWQRRGRFDLYHAALEVYLDGERYVIESAPVWDRPEPGRGVVVVGPVGMPWLGRWKWFRYEVRRWHDGLIPDVAAAVDGPRRLSSDPASAERLLDSAARFPAGTWGRDEQRAGDMWNSNSLVAWLLTVSDHDVDAVAPPEHGRAPGWAAGVVVGRRSLTSAPLQRDDEGLRVKGTPPVVDRSTDGVGGPGGRSRGRSRTPGEQADWDGAAGRRARRGRRGFGAGRVGDRTHRHLPRRRSPASRPAPRGNEPTDSEHHDEGPR